MLAAAEQYGAQTVSEPTAHDLAYSRLLAYIRMQMPGYIIGKHHALIAHYLQLLEKGDVTRLAIFMPPRHGKTMLASEFFSAWYMGRNPSHEIIFASYAQDRSDDVGKAVRDLMLTETHEQVFPEGRLRLDAKGTRKFQTVGDGTFFSTSWKGATTGRGANCFPAGTVIDTEVGKVPIEQLHSMRNPPLVLSLDTHGQLCYSKIVCSRKTKGKSIYEFQTRTGKTLRGTADHRIYSRTRGFIELRNLKIGEGLLCSPSDMESRQAFDFKMCEMRCFFCQVKCRCKQIHKTRLCRCLLFHQMFSARSCRKKQSSLCNVQSSFAKISYWKKNRAGLLSKLFKVKTTLGADDNKKTMQRMWSLVLAKRNKDTILQPSVCGCCPFKKNDGEAKFTLQKRRKLFQTVCGNATNNFRTRFFQMCRLRFNRKNGPCGESSNDDRKIKFNSSSYRRKPKKQSARKSCNNVHALPHHNAQVETDVVSMAPRLCGTDVEVYDLQIERTSSFFANGVYVHNCLILDDLIKDREDAQSDTNRRKREEWFSSSGYTRLMSDEGSSEGRILLIMTRWAYDDIAAYLLNQLAHENWHVLNCPAIAEEKDVLGREPGDALWPEKYPVERLKKVKQSVISEDWTALYQQRPLPKEGGMWKLHYFKEYNVHHLQRIEDLCRNYEELPEQLQWFHRIVISLDTAYKTDQMNDPSVLTVWGYSKNRQYLLEVAREKLEYPNLKKWIIKYHKKYERWNLGPVPVLIEDAASGQSLIQDFKVSDYRMPVIAIKPVKSKVVRAEHAAGYAESEAIVLPESATWLTDFKTEFAQFPYGPHDDQVDSVSQYIGWFYKPKKRKRGHRLYAK